jgi:hypothetical protein
VGSFKDLPINFVRRDLEERPDVLSPCFFKHIGGSKHISLDEWGGVFDRVVNKGAGREVEDDIDFFAESGDVTVEIAVDDSQFSTFASLKTGSVAV